MILRRLVAGAVASAAAAGVMLARERLGWSQGFDLFVFLGQCAHGGRLAGWGVHTVVGVLVWPMVWPAVDCLWRSARRARNWPRHGLVFGAVAWAAMMLGFLPLVGGSFFGLVIGWSLPLGLLAMHLVYGLLLAGLSPRR